jgi:hypothetical protein
MNRRTRQSSTSGMVTSCESRVLSGCQLFILRLIGLCMLILFVVTAALLSRVSPLFVTWKKRGTFSSDWKLRGCIGTFSAKELGAGQCGIGIHCSCWPLFSSNAQDLLCSNHLLSSQVCESTLSLPPFMTLVSAPSQRVSSLICVVTSHCSPNSRMSPVRPPQQLQP